MIQKTRTRRFSPAHCHAFSVQMYSWRKASWPVLDTKKFNDRARKPVVSTPQFSHGNKSRGMFRQQPGTGPKLSQSIEPGLNERSPQIDLQPVLRLLFFCLLFPLVAFATLINAPYIVTSWYIWRPYSIVFSPFRCHSSVVGIEQIKRTARH